jgi:hypothetical protein
MLRAGIGLDQARDFIEGRSSTVVAGLDGADEAAFVVPSH